MIKKEYDWLRQREKTDFLALEDGSIYYGYNIGSANDVVGEVVFNTGMTGYQEILSDPSYAGQIVVMTYPEIGNTGVNSCDMESRSLFANGFIVRQINEPSNWRCQGSLQESLSKGAIPCLAGVDTRALTCKLRSAGTLKGLIASSGRLSEDEAVTMARNWEGLDRQDYASKVTCKNPYTWGDPEESISSYWGICEELPPAEIKIAALDFGIKYNILRNLRRCGIKTTVFPASSKAEDILAQKPHGVFLSNGPADPAALSYAVKTIKSLLGKVPIFGICLGHQLLGLACGCETRRLKFGHHGCNHPVMNLETKKVEITSQNHNFVVDEKSIDPNVFEITHMNLNDNTVEGLRHKRFPALSVQYHPEAGPGPHDPFYLFDRFRKLIESQQNVN